MNFTFFDSDFKLRSFAVSLTAFICLCALGCSIPNLQSPECSEASLRVKKLYSIHVGNDMKPSLGNLKLLESFLTEALIQQLRNSSETEFDYFTQTSDYPKAFRVGTCDSNETKDKMTIQVVIFWRDDTRSEQRELIVEVLNQNGNWLIDNIEKKN